MSGTLGHWLCSGLLLGATLVDAQNCQLICNGDFEQGMVYNSFPQLLDAGQVPCWSTTATDNIIEIWSSPGNFENTPSYSGQFFVELNANQVSALYQAFTATPGEVVIIGVAHRARQVAPDVMSVDIGHDGTFTTVATVTDGLTWGYHTYNFTLPTGGSNTFTLRFTSISSGSGSPTIGNFIDDVSISLPPPEPTLTSTDVTCPGAADGSATAVVTGGAIPYAYLWAPSGGTNATASGLGPGPYTLTVTDANGCVDSAHVSIAEGTGPALELQATAPLCHGGTDGTASATVSSGQTPFSFQWSPSGGTGGTASGLSAGTYACTVTDAHGCTATEQVEVVEPTAVAVTTGDTLICENGTATLNASANGGTPGYAFTWSPDGPTVSPTGTTTYSVVATDAHGCLSTAQTATVTVDVVAAPAFTPDTNACAPVCVGFQTPAQQGFTYAWSFGDGATATGPAPPHCFADPGSYDISLTVTDAHGCTNNSTHAQAVVVRPTPVAAFDPSATLVPLDQATVIFQDASTDASTWLWHFDDPAGSTSTLASPAITFPSAGCYTVNVQVTSNTGCTDSTSLPICVRDVSAIYVPDAFTPDGDGINDSFHAEVGGEAPSSFELQVFDRWGRPLFDGITPEMAWTGSGTPQGVYAWKLRYARNGAHEERFGHVTLLR